MSRKMVFGLAAGLTLFMLMVIGVTAAGILSRSRVGAVQQAQVAPGAPATAGSQGQLANASTQVPLSAQAAAQIAMNLFPGATLARTPELVNYNGTVAYEVLLNQGAIYVDANSGQVLNSPAQSSGSGPFGRDGGHESEHESGGLFGGDGD